MKGREGTHGSPRVSRLQRLGVMTLTCVVVLGGAEVVLRSRTQRALAFYVWEPSSERIHHPIPELVPGITGPSRFLINSLGLRGDEFNHEADVRILAVGGSTTECSLLNQDEAWPQLVQTKLNASMDAHVVWVGNAGSSGRHTRDHLVQLKFLLPQLPRIDVVVILAGVNDLMLRLAEGDEYDPDFMLRADSEELELPRAFRLLPVAFEARLPWWKSTALWRLGAQARDRVRPSPLVFTGAGTVFEKWRGYRREAPQLHDELPDMTFALDEYRRNLNGIIDRSWKAGIRVVLVTQPYLWRDGLSEELEEMLWMGGIGHYQEQVGAEYYSASALAEGMGLYNEVLLDVAYRRGVDSLDLVPLLPQDQRSFYDDVHFNESGAEAAAEAVARKLEAFIPELPGGN